MSIAVGLTIAVCLVVLAYVRVTLDIALIKAIGAEALEPAPTPRIFILLRIGKVYGAIETFACMRRRLLALFVLSDLLGKAMASLQNVERTTKLATQLIESHGTSSPY